MSSPLWAGNPKEAGAEDKPTAVSSTPIAADKPAKPEASALESEVQDLRSIVEEQRAELEAQRAALKAEQLRMEALEEKLSKTPAEPATAPAAVVSTAVAAETPAMTSAAVTSAGVIPGQPIGGAPRKLSASLSPQDTEKPGPLYFKIGGAEFYPLGFMDAMNVFRTTQLGTIGTNFGSIAFNNTVAGRLTESRFSIQNSRIGLRTHAKFGEADVTGYLEADFLGYQPANANDTSNSNTLRMRLYWVDYKRKMWEVLAGQSWSFLTPNRNGLSALPGDLFYSQDVDTNYQLGLTWARQATFRVIAHPSKNVAMGVAFENPEQTLPSSVTLPLASGVGAGYVSQFDSNSGNTSSATGVNNPNTPTLHPDIIPKIAFDFKPGGHQVHFDFAGLFRTFRAVNVIATPATITAANTVYSTIHGGGVEGGMNVEVVKNFRVVATGFYSSGGGRYIGSTGAPDLIVRADGNLSSVKSGSGIGGFEYQPRPNTLIYGYYSGAYFGKDYNAITSGGTTTFVGYGYPGSPNSANRYIYEPTFGIHQYLWRNANYGDLRLMTQYSYVSRTPWNVGTGPHTAHLSMVYIDLRYDLP
jgi:hypothetical protein